jgi:hypothetical protein
MERVAGTEGFDIAREKFVLIGITGQTYSGQSSFFNEVMSQGHLGVMDHSGIYEDLVLSYLEGDEDAINWYQQSGSPPPYKEADGNVVFPMKEDTDYIMTTEFLTDETRMHFLRTHSFKIKIRRISESLKKIVENNPHITKDMNVPIFVDLPMAGSINYFDYVDKLIVTTRPRDPDPNSWYVKYITLDHDPNNDNFIDLCVCLELAGHILVTDDAAFDKIDLSRTEDIEYIENNGTYEEFVSKVNVVLDRYAHLCQLTIKPMIEEQIKEIL